MATVWYIVHKIFFKIIVYVFQLCWKQESVTRPTRKDAKQV